MDAGGAIGDAAREPVAKPSMSARKAHPLLAHLPEDERHKVLVTLDEASLTVEEWARRRAPPHPERAARPARAAAASQRSKRVSMSDAETEALAVAGAAGLADREAGREHTASHAASAPRPVTERARAVAAEQVVVDEVEIGEGDTVERPRAASRSRERSTLDEAEAVSEGATHARNEARERVRSAGASERLSSHHRRAALRAAALAGLPLSLWLEQAVVAQARASGVTLGFEADVSASADNEEQARDVAASSFREFPAYLRRLLIRAAAAADVPPQLWFEQAVLDQARLGATQACAASESDTSSGRRGELAGAGVRSVDTVADLLSGPQRRLAARAAARADLPTSLWIEQAIVERAQADLCEPGEPAPRPAPAPAASTRTEETQLERGSWRGGSGWEVIAAAVVGALLATALLLLSPLFGPSGKVSADVKRVSDAAGVAQTHGARTMPGGTNVSVATVVLTPSRSTDVTDRARSDRVTVYREIDRSRSRRADDVGSARRPRRTAGCGLDVDCRPIETCVTCEPANLYSSAWPPSASAPRQIDAPA